jgi:hypothetical protein
MSFFSNLLLGAQTSKDTDLDALFQRTQSAPAVSTEQNWQWKSSEIKRQAPAASTSSASIVKPPEDIIAAARSAKRKNQAEPKRKAKKLQKSIAAVDPDSDDDEDLEESYAVKKARQHAETILKAASHNGKGKAKIQEKSVAANETIQDTSSDSEDDAKELVHEADIAARKAAKSGGQAVKSKRKVQPEQDASPADKDARTTFLGNVPIACVSTKVNLQRTVRLL